MGRALYSWQVAAQPSVGIFDPTRFGDVNRTHARDLRILGSPNPEYREVLTPLGAAPSSRTTYVLSALTRYCDCMTLQTTRQLGRLLLLGTTCQGLLAPPHSLYMYSSKGSCTVIVMTKCSHDLWTYMFQCSQSHRKWLLSFRLSPLFAPLCSRVTWIQSHRF